MTVPPARPVTVFFYGLFMDEEILAAKGVRPSSARLGHLEGYGLRIGARATLVPDPGRRAYGVLMTISSEDATSLYAEASVADYVAEPVAVTLPDGTHEPALCYLLPGDQLAGTNPRYADALFTLAARLGFPDEYLQEIRDLGGDPRPDTRQGPGVPGER